MSKRRKYRYWSKEEKHRIIKRLFDEEIGVRELCIYMEVSRSGYYKWRKRKGILNRYQVNQETAKGLILEIHKKHQTYGYRNIAEQIRLTTDGS